MVILNFLFEKVGPQSISQGYFSTSFLQKKKKNSHRLIGGAQKSHDLLGQDGMKKANEKKCITFKSGHCRLD